MDIIDLEKQKEQSPKIQQGFSFAEIPFLGFGVIGILFKLLHWPGATFFLMLGLGLFAILLFPVGLFYKFWQMKAINFLQSTVCIGILFKLMTWPEFQTFLLAGSLCSAGVIILFIFLNVQKKGFIKHNKLITFRILSLSILSLLMSLMGARAYYRTFVQDDPIGATLYEKAADEPESKEAYDAYQSYRKSMNSPYYSDSTNVAK